MARYDLIEAAYEFLEGYRPTPGWNGPGLDPAYIAHQKSQAGKQLVGHQMRRGAVQLGLLGAAGAGIVGSRAAYSWYKKRSKKSRKNKIKGRFR